MPSPPEAPLDDLRVVDLSGGVAGQFASRILSDWGAQVVLVESPAGAPTRRVPPLRSGVADCSESLLFFHLNTSKRSVSLDVSDSKGWQRLEDLVARADIVLTDADHNVSSLRRDNPRLIACEIRDFTRGGPYADWIGSEIIHQALSGLMNTTGRSDRAPLYGFGHRAYYSAGAAAAAGILGAVWERDHSGTGQLLELSVHEVAASMAQNLVSQYGYSGANPGRGRYVGASGTFATADGWLVLFCPAGRWQAFCEALDRPDLVCDSRFGTFDQLVANWREAMQELAPSIRSHEAETIARFARSARCMAAKVLTPAEVLACEHLAAREFWKTVRSRDAAVPVLGPMFRFDSGQVHVPSPPPRIGADTNGVLRALSRTTVSGSIRRGPTQNLPATLLSGVRVLELTTAWAGPMTARILGVFGADVIKIESVQVLDVWRGPAANGDPSRYPNGDPGDAPINRNAWFNTQNHGKRSLAIDLKSPGARAVLDALIPTIDVVVSNFTNGVLERLNLGFDDLCRWRDDIVLIEMPVAGRGGPLSDISGVGPTMEAITGMTSLIGYGDGVPVSTGPAYLDPMGAFNATAAVMLGLRARDRTGLPQHIELAQREAALHWLGEELLAAAATGTWTEPKANTTQWASPHNAYRAAGDDAWIVVAVESDDQWTKMCSAIDQMHLADDERFASSAARVANRELVDGVVEAWTSTRDKLGAASDLQSCGVPAAAVLSAADLYRDPQLAATGFLVEFDHREAGRHLYQGLPFHFDRTPIRYGAPAPCFGEHTEQILLELGLSPDHISQLKRAGVVATGWRSPPSRTPEQETT